MTNAQILIVEDEVIIARDMQNTLKSLGYAVTAVVSSGREAVQKAVETHPDLVLMDIKLKEDMDGVEAAEEIRARFDIPVVYLTAYTDDETLQRAKITEPFGYVLKPFETRELRNTIEMALYKHEMDKKLKESEARYRAVSELTSDFAYSFRVEPDGTLVLEWMTEAFARITGFTPDEVGARGDWTSIVHPDSRSIVHQRLQAVLSGQSDARELGIVTKSGEARWLHVYSRPVWDEVQGRVVRIYGAAQDITERKRAEEEIKESEEKFRSIFESAYDSLIYLDIFGRIIDVNKRALEAVGMSKEEVVGKHFTKLKIFPSRELPRVASAFAKGLIGGPKALAMSIKGKEGKEIPLECLASFVKRHGKITGVMMIARDITERKRAEEEIRQRTAQLEALQEVGLELTAQLDLDALLRSIVSRASELLGGTGGGLYLYRPDRDVIEWAVVIGTNPAPTGAVLQRGEGLSGRVWETGEPLIVDDYQHWEGQAAAYEGYPSTSVVGVPVRWGKEFLGVLNVNAAPTHTFSPADAELLGLFATQAAIAIQNARLFEQEREQRQLAEALEEAAAAVNSTLDLDQVFDRILEQVERIVGGDAFDVMLIEDGVARPVRWRGYEQFGGEEAVSTVAFRVSEVRNLQQIVETREPLVIPDTAAYDGWVDVPGIEWPRSHIAAPIQTGGVTVGFLNLNRACPGQFGPKDARRLEAFASHVATAIKNARLYEQAQRDAKTKSVLLREINHRVKNNMAIIIGLLRAARRHAGMEESQAAYQVVIQDLVNQVQGLATVHKLLSASEWSPLLLSELTAQILRSSLQMLPRGKHISVAVAPSPVLVTPDQAHNLALVINELVTNTVKYALRERDAVHITVRIALEEEDDTVLFEFRNDGPGYPEEVLRLERHSVGFGLIQDLVRGGLCGELALHNDQGAVAIIRFPAEVQ